MLRWPSLLALPITIRDPGVGVRCCWFDCWSLTTCWIWFWLLIGCDWLLSLVDRDMSVAAIYDAITKIFLIEHTTNCRGNHQHSAPMLASPSLGIFHWELEWEYFFLVNKKNFWLSLHEPRVRLIALPTWSAAFVHFTVSTASRLFQFPGYVCMFGQLIHKTPVNLMKKCEFWVDSMRVASMVTAKSRHLGRFHQKNYFKIQNKKQTKKEASHDDPDKKNGVASLPHGKKFSIHFLHHW